MEGNKRIKSYVIRASRISPAQKHAIEEYSEKHCIKYENRPIDWKKYLTGGNLFIEIGFGMGKATAEIALRNPDNFYIGIEVHRPGIGRLLNEIENRDIQNLKIICHDAYDVLNIMIADSTIDGFNIFFPDPWPKKKHRKRRLINEEFSLLLSSKLKRGGYIYAVTDWEDYADQIIDVFRTIPVLREVQPGTEILPWRPETSFEEKGRRNKHNITELYFKRR